MKNEKVFFHPIDGSGPLTISWSSEPKGDAVEAKKGFGVGFFSKNGDLLSVIFDEVEAKKDHQILEFGDARVEITVKNDQITFILTQKKTHPLIRKRRSKQTSSTR
jgi:hypothetical protein